MKSKSSSPCSKKRLQTHGDRLAWVDQARGFAVMMMIAYHFCYDLAYDHLVPWSTNQMLVSSGWIIWRNTIVSLFLALVGISLSLRMRFKPGWNDFWKRWSQIAGATVLVSIGSYWFAGERWIYFGVLHFIAAATLIGRCIYSKTTSAWIFILCGAGLLLLSMITSPAFDAAPLNIIGLNTHKPQTEDYVPLVPWLGIVFLGMAFGQYLQQEKNLAMPLLRREPSLSRIPAALAYMGRHSLLIYLIHQPILMGSLMLLTNQSP